MLASCLLQTAFFTIMPRPMCFPTHFLSLSFPTLFSYLLSAISYLACILDPALTLQKPEPRKTLVVETAPAAIHPQLYCLYILVQLYLPFSLPDKDKAIWRITAPPVSEVAVTPLSFTLQLRRSYYFSSSPGRAAVQRVPEKPGSRMSMFQDFLRNTGAGCLCGSFQVPASLSPVFLQMGVFLLSFLLSFLFSESPFKFVPATWYFH